MKLQNSLVSDYFCLDPHFVVVFKISNMNNFLESTFSFPTVFCPACELIT